MSIYTTQVVGSVYSSVTGIALTSGRLLIRPKKFVPVAPQFPHGGGVIAPISTEVHIPPTGELDFTLAVPEGGITYVVEYDPTPNDTATPIKLKPGYFKNEWSGLTQVPVHDISELS